MTCFQIVRTAAALCALGLIFFVAGDVQAQAADDDAAATSGEVAGSDGTAENVEEGTETEDERLDRIEATAKDGRMRHARS